MLLLFVNFHFLNYKFTPFIFYIKENLEFSVLGDSSSDYVMSIFISRNTRIVDVERSGQIFRVEIAQDNQSMVS